MRNVLQEFHEANHRNNCGLGYLKGILCEPPTNGQGLS